MKKIFCFLITLCMAINVFALRLGIASVEWYFEQEIIGKENDCTLLLFGPNEDDFNSSWHLSLKSDDSDFIHYRKDWRICSKEKLQTYVNQEAAKGNVVIHYKNNLYYVGVNEKLRGKVPVETFLNNFFEGKTFITEEHQIGDMTYDRYITNYSGYSTKVTYLTKLIECNCKISAKSIVCWERICKSLIHISIIHG